MSPVQDMTRVWGGRTLAERKAERRAALLKAAIDIVGERGSSAMTTKAVCERAGIAERYLYESFESRDALLLAAFDECLTRGTVLLSEAFGDASDGPVVARLRQLLNAAADAAVDDPALVRILFIESAGDPILRERAQMLQATMEALCIQLTSEDGAARDGIDAAGAAFVIGGCISAFTAWVSGRIVISREEAIDSAVRAFALILGLEAQPGS